MGTNIALTKKYDSKTVSLLAIFLAMVIALEIYPIIGITDIPIPGMNFTIDWTGIPLILIFLFFGPVFAFFSIGVMGVAIGYRNPIGATFKVFSEFYKIMGILLVWSLLRKREVSYLQRVLLYAISASFFCAIGMFLTNIQLLQIFYGLSAEIAFGASIILIPWNLLQTVINVVGGMFLFRTIPEDLKYPFVTNEAALQDELILEKE